METLIGIGLIVAGIATNQVEGVLIKQYNRKYAVGGFIFTSLISLFSMAFFLLTDTNGLHFSAELIGYGVVGGIFYATASLLTFVAIGCGPFALSQLILSYGLVFKIAYGLFILHEPTTWFTYLGLAAIALSIFLTRPEKAPEQKRASWKWAVSITVAFLGSGLLGVLQKMQQLRFHNQVNHEFMVVTLGVSAVSLFLVGVLKDGKHLGYIFRHGFLYTLGAGVSNGLTNMSILAVNTLLPLSFSAPLRSGLKIVIVYVISQLLFHEHFIKRQRIGVLLGVAALVLLNIK